MFFVRLKCCFGDVLWSRVSFYALFFKYLRTAVLRDTLEVN